MAAASERSPSPQRRQRLSAEARREQIIRAATTVVAADGYANATLTEIAATAGVAKGLIWHYFDDRDDLMKQALARLVEDLRDALVADLDVSAPADQVIRAVFAHTAESTRSHGTELATIDQIVHNLRTPDGRQLVTMLDYEETYAQHGALLARGQSEGLIRRADVRSMAVAYQGMLDAMIGYLQAHPEADPLVSAGQHADVFLLGAATPAGR